MSVIAAIYGDRFISSVSDKWLADQLDEQKKITQSLTDAMLATEHTLDVSKVSGLSKEEQDILSAMSASPIKFLSLTTLQNNLGHDQKLSDLRKNLQNLEDEGVVSSLVGHDHKERFFIIGKELQ
ncbi:MAG: hypothetical protein JJ934_13030 [Pseudomonadales bacterium]|nr:hypothetical protein [Pseudomonadales bacterium]